MDKVKFLDQVVPSYKGNTLGAGVYFATIKNVEPINVDKIKVTFDLVLDDDSTYTLSLRTNLTPKHSWDMINRLAQACRTRKLKEFIGCEVWVSVVINEQSDFIRFENVQDVQYADPAEEFNYDLTEKGYFIV